jgi:hypothetical protein
MNVKVLANGGLKRDNLNPGFRLRRGNLSDIALQVQLREPSLGRRPIPSNPRHRS